MTSRRMLRNSVIAAADQAVLSAFSLAVGVLFIKFAPKSEYASYVLLMTLLLLAQSLQNALVNSPTMTLRPRQLRDEGQSRVDAAAQRLQSALLLALLAMCGCAGVWLALTREDDAWLAPAMAAATAGILMREFVRARFFVRHKAGGALASDVVYALVALAGVAALFLAGQFHALQVLTVIGIAGVATGLLAGARAAWPFGKLTESDRADLLEFWQCAKWALPSVVNSWLQANAFLFIVGALMSKDAVADLSAARLLIVPLSLLAVGWSNAFRPRAAAMYAAAQTPAIDRLARRSMLGFVAAGLSYAVLLWLGMPLLQQALLGPKYSGLTALVAAWLLYFVVMSIRGVGMGCMLSSPSAFRILYIYGCVALAVALPGVAIASAWQSAIGVVLALALSELVLCILIAGWGWPALRRAATAAQRQ